MIRLSNDNQPCDLNGLELIPEWKNLPKEIQKVLLPLLGQYLDPNYTPAPDHGNTNVRCFLDPYGMKQYLSARPEMSELGMLPIAEDDGGSCFCISIHDETLGKVYFWDDDSVIDIGIENLIISESLSSFFELIKYDI